MKLIADSLSADRVHSPDVSFLPEILVIDDDPQLQAVLAKSFESSLKVVSVLSGRGGIDLIKDSKHRFCCVLLDYQLPGCDGIEVLRRIRSIDSEIPVIFMTGFGDLELVRSALHIGAREYFPKPVQPEELFKSITKWIPTSSKNWRTTDVKVSPKSQPDVPNRFVATNSGGNPIEGRIIRFGTQSIVVEFDHLTDEDWFSERALSNVQIVHGRFSINVSDAKVKATVFSLRNVLEISLPGTWMVDENRSGPGRANASRSDLPAGLQSSVSDLVNLLGEIREDLDALEDHLESWSEFEKVAIEKSFIDQVERDYFPAIDAAVFRFEEEASSLASGAAEKFAPIIREIFFPMILGSPFMSRVIEMPIGVPGDFGVLGQILGNPFEGHSLYSRTLNAWILNTGAAKAYRFRVELLSQCIGDVVEQANRAGRRARVLSIGSGVAYEVQRFISHHCHSKVDFELLDFSEETRKETGRLIDLCRADSKAEAIKVDIKDGSIVDLVNQSRNRKARGGGYDFVYCTGLFDYLSDRLCREVTNYMEYHTAPEGTLVVSNYTTKNPIRRFMDLVLDWQLIYRSDRKLESIIKEAIPNMASTSVFSDPDEVEAYGLVGPR